MRPTHIFLAVLITLIWGINFIFIEFALYDLPPLFLSALRFLVVGFPGILLIKRPQVPLRLFLLYTLFTFMLQFMFLFAGMHAGMPVGLTALVAQTQVFFSLFFSVIFLREKLQKLQVLGALIAFTGIILVGFCLDKQGTLYGFILILFAAMSWGIGNIFMRKMGRVNSVSLVAWSGFFSAIPLLLISGALEGIGVILGSLQHASWLTYVSVLYIAYISTWIGYGLWGWLLSRYQVTELVPFVLLVPLISMLSSVIFLSEPMQPWKIIAFGLVITGVSINILGPRIQTRYQQKLSVTENF